MKVELDGLTIDRLAAAVASRVAELVSRPSEDSWLNAREAAAYLHLNYSTLKERAARGELPAHQDAPGGSLYFKRSELDDYRRGPSAAEH